MSHDMIMMNEALYDYVDEVSNREPALLAELRAATEKATPWFRMQITAQQGQFMDVLVRISGARRILEVGTFTGYSSIVMASAMPPDGHITTCDINDDYAGIAREFWAKAGVADKIRLRLGPAAETLDALLAEGEAGSYDLCFIDADKLNYGTYWDRGLELVRPGGLMIADNTLFQGTVTKDYTDERLIEFWRNRGRTEEHFEELLGNTRGARAFNEKVKNDDRVVLAMVAVGDGMTFGVKK
jgi:predicted O-methyltransferase YrrM